MKGRRVKMVRPTYCKYSFVCLFPLIILCGDWNPNLSYQMDAQRWFEGIKGIMSSFPCLGIEVIHAHLILDPPLLLSAGKKDAKLAASILATLNKQCPPTIHD